MKQSDKILIMQDRLLKYHKMILRWISFDLQHRQIQGTLVGDLSPLGTECFHSKKQSTFEQKFGTTKGHLLLSLYLRLLCTTPVNNEIATKYCVLAKKRKNNSDTLLSPPPPWKKILGGPRFTVTDFCLHETCNVKDQ